MVLPTYAEIMREIGARKGNVIERAEIEKLLQAAVAAGIAGEKKITLWLQNWTSESFDAPADYGLDWSAHFDRSTRKVPSPETWNKQLIPELEALKKKILAGTERAPHPVSGQMRFVVRRGAGSHFPHGRRLGI